MKFMKIFAILIAGILSTGYAHAKSADDGTHKLVIQVSSADEQTQKIAINNAVNVSKAYGPGEVKVEIVAYGPGLSLLTAKNKQSSRIKGLALGDDIQFSACGNTIAAVKKKTGKDPVLTKGVKVVPSGVQRIMELQEKGYAYVRP